MCVKKLKDDDIQCDKLVLKNGKSMRWVDGPRGHKVYKFESTVNAVAAETPEDSRSLALNSEFDIQTDGSRRSAGSEAGQPDLQELLECHGIRLDGVDPDGQDRNHAVACGATM